MSKLVLLLANGTTVDIPLDKERLTLGRRADNDICLPNAAVSGEHAAVVTVRTDSFLEDLQSTNGTLVNGNPITKHFLRDGDLIDIGQHELVYRARDEPKEPKVVSPLSRRMARDFEKVELAKPFAHAPGSLSYAPLADGLAAAGSGGATISTDDGRAYIGNDGRVRFGDGLPPHAAPAPAKAKASGAVADARGSGATPASWLDDPLSPPQAGAAEGDAEATDPGRPATAPRRTWARLKVLSGALAGRVIAITQAETTIGRAGVQVAAIVASADGLRLRFVEGTSPPTVNGRALASGEITLAFGDVIEIARTPLELLPASPSTADE